MMSRRGSSALGFAALALALTAPAMLRADNCHVRGQLPTTKLLSQHSFGYGIIQQSLNIFDNAHLDIDSSAGPATRDTIKGFQRRNGLPETGEADTEFLKALEKRWRAVTPVPPISSTAGSDRYDPDFTAHPSIKDGTCVVALRWADEVKEVRFDLSQPLTECRLTRFTPDNRPIFVQNGAVIGVMVDIKGAQYGNTPCCFTTPVIAVWPDRHWEVPKLSTYEKHALAATTGKGMFPDYAGPYDNKLFPFRQEIRRDGYADFSSNLLWRRWDFGDCAAP